MATTKDYVRVMGKAWEEVSDEQMRNVWENHAKSYVRAFWKQEMGRPFPYKIRIGSGNRNTWLQGSVFTINPKKGWRDINHDMSHFLHWRKTGLSHKGGHMSVERDGAQLIKRRFLESGPKPKKAKSEVSVVAKRAASVDRRIVGWEKKLKRAKTALKKLKKQKRYYVKKLAEDRLNFRLEPRKRAKRMNIFEFGEKHGVEVEREDWGDGNIKYIVTPQEGADTDADPFYGDHYVHDAKEARERVLVYASAAGLLTPLGTDGS